MHAYIARTCTSFIDVPDKISLAIYFSGCSIRCKNCHNKELWDKKNGKRISLTDLLEKIETHPLAKAVVFLGGEPTDQVGFLIELCKKITTKEKVLYTGREFEVLPKDLLKSIDMIICGPYRSDLHVDNAWPASTNQRIFIRKGKKWKQQNTYMDIQKNSKSYTKKQTQEFSNSKGSPGKN